MYISKEERRVYTGVMRRRYAALRRKQARARALTASTLSVVTEGRGELARRAMNNLSLDLSRNSSRICVSNHCDLSGGLLMRSSAALRWGDSAYSFKGGFLSSKHYPRQCREAVAGLYGRVPLSRWVSRVQGNHPVPENQTDKE